MQSPTLRRLADRSYDLLSDVGELRAFFDILGFKHAGDGKATDLWMHRWYHLGPDGKTVVVLFKPHDGQPPRLSLLGPRIDTVDTIAIEPIEVAE